MQFKGIIQAAAVLALTAVATTASAGYQVLDGWRLQTSATDTSGIGRMNLVSGTATVEQEVNGLNQVFVGGRFTESGVIFSVTYTKENVVGAGDSGAPTAFGEVFTISFANVAGLVTSLSGTGGYGYKFTSGTFSLSGTAGTYATGSIIGLGGNAASTAIIGGINGDSTLLAQVLTQTNGFNLYDSLNVNLAADLAAGNVLFESVTNNNSTNSLGVGACSFDGTQACVSVSVASAGDAYLVRAIPEPGSMALAGLALLGVGALSRRSKKA